ncbi:hypothetical protein E4U55_002070, partial [Claviceps digitariae]
STTTAITTTTTAPKPADAVSRPSRFSNQFDASSCHRVSTTQEHRRLPSQGRHRSSPRVPKVQVQTCRETHTWTSLSVRWVS